MGKIVFLLDLVSSIYTVHPPDKKKILFRNFIFKDVPQLQYKNPDVQFVTSKSAAVGSPRIDVFFGKPPATSEYGSFRQDLGCGETTNCGCKCTKQCQISNFTINK